VSDVISKLQTRLSKQGSAGLSFWFEAVLEVMRTARERNELSFGWPTQPIPACLEEWCASRVTEDNGNFNYFTIYRCNLTAKTKL